MNEGIGALSEREKETLRFLLVGHDAKSIALNLGLSVHTVNERLRDARRKLGVSSSREAARLLADAEHPGANSLGDKGFGVAPSVPVWSIAQPDQDARAGHFLAWLGAGMLIMSLVIAALVLSPHLSETSRNASISANGDAGSAGMETTERQTIEQEIQAMAGDVSEALHHQPLDNPQFGGFLARQVYLRSLSEAVIFKVARDNHVEALATVNFDTGALLGISRRLPAAFPADHKVISFSTQDRLGAVVRLNGSDNMFLAGYKAP